MGVAVVGGMLTSTFLTLLIIPVVYTLLSDFGAWLRKLFHRELAHLSPSITQAEYKQ